MLFLSCFFSLICILFRTSRARLKQIRQCKSIQRDRVLLCFPYFSSPLHLSHFPFLCHPPSLSPVASRTILTYSPFCLSFVFCVRSLILSSYSSLTSPLSLVSLHLPCVTPQTDSNSAISLFPKLLNTSLYLPPLFFSPVSPSFLFLLSLTLPPFPVFHSFLALLLSFISLSNIISHIFGYSFLF